MCKGVIKKEIKNKLQKKEVIRKNKNIYSFTIYINE